MALCCDYLSISLYVCLYLPTCLFSFNNCIILPTTLLLFINLHTSFFYLCIYVPNYLAPLFACILSYFIYPPNFLPALSDYLFNRLPTCLPDYLAIFSLAYILFLTYLSKFSPIFLSICMLTLLTCPSLVTCLAAYLSLTTLVLCPN